MQNLEILPIVLSILGVVITSLVGIIVWMAKGLMKKVDEIVKGQESTSVETTAIKKDVEGLTADMQAVKYSLNEIPDIKLKAAQQEALISSLREQFYDYKLLTQESSKMINEIRLIMASQLKQSFLSDNSNKTQ